MSVTPTLQQLQRQLLNYLRCPQSSLLPEGFAPERTAVYVDLLYNKFDESLTACFPVIHRILPPDGWRALLLDFIARHRCRSTYYRQIPDEFVQYLQQERHQPEDMPFLAELAHFEWTEFQLSIAEAEPFAVESLTGEQLLAGAPVFAPVMQLMQYRWPVQQITYDDQPDEPPATATFILGFRDADDQVQFIALNPATARLIALLGNGLSGQQALAQLGAGLDNSSMRQFMQFGLEALSELHRRGAIINVR
ncbi:MAG: HvfC family RiPP maturation protein [Methylobacter sp.]